MKLEIACLGDGPQHNAKQEWKVSNYFISRLLLIKPNFKDLIHSLPHKESLNFKSVIDPILRFLVTFLV